MASLDTSRPPSAHCWAATSCGGVRSNWPSSPPLRSPPPRGPPPRPSFGRGPPPPPSLGRGPARAPPPRPSRGGGSAGLRSSLIDMLCLRGWFSRRSHLRSDSTPHGYDIFV